MRTGSPTSGARHRDALPLPAREGVRPPVLEPREADGRERGARARRAGLFGEAADPEGEGDVLLRREDGHELVRLEDEAEPLAAEPRARALVEARDVAPLEEERPGVGRVEKAEEVQERRLAAAGRAGEDREGPRLEGERRVGDADDPLLPRRYVFVRPRASRIDTRGV